MISNHSEGGGILKTGVDIKSSNKKKKIAIFKYKLLNFDGDSHVFERMKTTKCMQFAIMHPQIAG